MGCLLQLCFFCEYDSRRYAASGAAAVDAVIAARSQRWLLFGMSVGTTMMKRVNCETVVCMRS